MGRDPNRARTGDDPAKIVLESAFGNHYRFILKLQILQNSNFPMDNLSITQKILELPFNVAILWTFVGPAHPDM
jgi:hypothetical protein